MKITRSLILALLLSIPITAYSHSGGTTAKGCHRETKTGGYHCHDGSEDESGYGISYAGKKVYTNYDEINKTQNPQSKEIAVEDNKAIKAAFPKGKTCEVQLKLVLDGDTILVTYKGQDYKVRLYGIDCPEESQKHGLKAGIALFEYLATKPLRITPKDYDKYGRVVGIVYADDMNANERMIKDGHAWQYRKYCKEDFCNKWSKYEEEARDSGDGLWESSEVQAPWEYRKAMVKQ